MLAHEGGAFLASATPAAGKTTFGLRVAHRMLEEGRVGRVAVIAPTTHICRQWAADAARYGIDLEPNRPNGAGPEPRDRHGVAVTYATLAAGPGVHRRRCAELPTLLIADEPHHMGELASWGRSTQAAFERARFRLLLSGTPFRSDNSPIPWVTIRRRRRLAGRLRLRLHGGADRRRLPPGHLPHLRRRHGVGLRRPPPPRRLHRRAARRRGRPPPAHGAGPRGRLGRPRARRRPSRADRPARRRAPRRRRARDRRRQGARREARRPAGAHLGRAPGDRDLRRAGRLRADRPLRRRHGHLARVRADGLRGRRRPAPAGRRLRDQRAHRAVLPPGRRALHPPHARCRAIRCRTCSCPATRR